MSVLYGSCRGQAVGLGDERVLITCDDRSAEAIRAAFEGTQSAQALPPSITAIDFRGVRDTISCDRALATCATHAPLDRAQMEAARRRRPKREQ